MYVVGILTNDRKLIEIDTVPSRQEAEELQRNLGEDSCRISPSVVPFQSVFYGCGILYSPRARAVLERELAEMRASRKTRLELISYFNLHGDVKISAEE